jgi:hypothetical protein
MLGVFLHQQKAKTDTQYSETALQDSKMYIKGCADIYYANSIKYYYVAL